MIDREQIAEDVRHNHQRLIDLADANLKNLERVCEKYGIDTTRVEDVCTTFDVMGNE